MLEIGSKPIFKVYIILNKIFWNGLNSFLFHFLPFLLFFNWEVHSPSCYSVGKGTMDGCVVPQLVIFNFLQPLHVCCFHPAPNTKNKTAQIKNLTTFPKENKEHWKTSRNNEIDHISKVTERLTWLWWLSLCITLINIITNVQHLSIYLARVSAWHTLD